MPPQELITNRRGTPSMLPHTAGLLESMSPGRFRRGAEISRAEGTRTACANSALHPIAAASALLAQMRNQVLERVIRGHVRLQRRHGHVAFAHCLVIAAAAIGMVLVEGFLDPV